MIFSKSAIEERRRRAALNMDEHLQNGDVVLIACGREIQKPGGHDQNYPFVPHPNYYWSSGRTRAGGVVAYSKSSGWHEFAQPVALDERIWGHVSEEAEGTDIAQLPQWLKKNHFSKVFSLGSAVEVEIPRANAENLNLLTESFLEARRVKDSEEVQKVAEMAEVASYGYKVLQGAITEGISENELRIAYEAEIFKRGADSVPYETLVGTGDNGSILHASPTSRKTKRGEILLVDAGAAKNLYCVDITRVYPVSGSLSTEQKSIYDLVKKAQTKALNACQIGQEWRDVHLTAASVLAEGLRDLQILRVNPDVALESGAVSVFFPHGIGHMFGMQVRDVGGRLNTPARKYAGARIRIDMPLKENYMMTVEPGLYFIKALLDSDEVQRSYKDHINWNEVQKWRDFGGIRIEDDILIQKSGPLNLTQAIPKF